MHRCNPVAAGLWHLLNDAGEVEWSQGALCKARASTVLTAVKLIEMFELFKSFEGKPNKTYLTRVDPLSIRSLLLSQLCCEYE
jgi:hypothetical protein